MMTMAPHEEDPEMTRPVFRGLRELRDDLNGQALTAEPVTELSMGMSNDFKWPLKKGQLGATWINSRRERGGNTVGVMNKFMNFLGLQEEEEIVERERLAAQEEQEPEQQENETSALDKQ